MKRQLLNSFIALLNIIFLGCSLSVTGQSIVLDPTFDSNGFNEIPFGTHDVGEGLAEQTDGKIVVIGTSEDGAGIPAIVLARYNTDGTLDTGFGFNGFVLISTGNAGDEGRAVAIQSDGKIVACGVSGNGPFIEGVVVRYLADGSLDNTFGTNGVAYIAPAHDVVPEDLLIQPDGKIVVAGTGYPTVEGDFMVARLNADGTMDTNFGTAGITEVEIDGTDSGESVAIQSDGKIVVGGATDNGLVYSASVIRLTTTGGLDNTFDGDGKVLTANGFYIGAMSVAIQADGKILVGGETREFLQFEFFVMRFNTDGSFDANFNGSGSNTVNFGQDAYGTSLAVDPLGRIFLGGDQEGGGGLFAVAVFRPDGTLIESSSHDIGSSGDLCNKIALDANGRLLMFGEAEQSTGNPAMVLARFDITIGINELNANPANLNIFPNPVEQELQVNYQMEKAGKLQLALYSTDGKLIEVLMNNTFRNAGNQTETFNLDGKVAAGNYLLVLQTAEGQSTFSINKL